MERKHMWDFKGFSQHDEHDDHHHYHHPHQQHQQHYDQQHHHQHHDHHQHQQQQHQPQPWSQHHLQPPAPASPMRLPPHYPLQHLHPSPRRNPPHSHDASSPAPPSFRNNPEVVMVTSRCSTFMLTTAALFSGAVTLVTLALAVGTDYWLFMQEPYRVPPDDLAKFNLTGQVETRIMVYVRSGLWSVCTINLREGNRSIPDICLRIDFTQKGTGRMDGAPTCMTIVGAIRIAAPLPVGALILTLCGIILSGLGSIQRTGKTVIAAIMYILAGLCLAVGVVLFISAIYDELGYHSQTAESSEFQYSYGWSFYVAGSAFVSSEVAAVLCVTLYLRHNARVRDIVRIIPGLEEKLEEEKEKEEGEREREERSADLLRVEEREEVIDRNCYRLGVC